MTWFVLRLDQALAKIMELLVACQVNFIVESCGVDLFHNGDLLIYSIICMTVSLSGLV